MTVDTQALRKRLEERKSGWPFPSDRALVDHIPALLSEIERKDAEVARLIGIIRAIDSLRGPFMSDDDVASIWKLVDAALSPNPGDPTPTGVSA